MTCSRGGPLNCAREGKGGPWMLCFMMQQGPNRAALQLHVGRRWRQVRCSKGWPNALDACTDPASILPGCRAPVVSANSPSEGSLQLGPWRQASCRTFFHSLSSYCNIANDVAERKTSVQQTREQALATCETQLCAQGFHHVLQRPNSSQAARSTGPSAWTVVFEV